MSKQYILNELQIRLIAEHAISEYVNTMDDIKALDYAIEILPRILATNDTRPTTSLGNECHNRPTKENAPNANADIREVFTNENHFENEQEIKEL